MATSDPGVGQFVFSTGPKQLSWDVDGAAGTAAVLVAYLTGRTAWSGSEILVVA